MCVDDVTLTLSDPQCTREGGGLGRTGGVITLKGGWSLTTNVLLRRLPWHSITLKLVGRNPPITMTISGT